MLTCSLHIRIVPEAFNTDTLTSGLSLHAKEVPDAYASDNITSGLSLHAKEIKTVVKKTTHIPA